MLVAWYAAIVSTLAMIVAALGLLLHYIQHRQRSISQEPQVICECTADNDRPGWFQMEMIINNRSSDDLALTSIRIIEPRSLVIADEEAATDWSISYSPQARIPISHGRSLKCHVEVSNKDTPAPTAPHHPRSGRRCYFYLSFLAANPASSDRRNWLARWYSRSQSSAKLLIRFEPLSAKYSSYRISQKIKITIPTETATDNNESSVQK